MLNVKIMKKFSILLTLLGLFVVQGATAADDDFATSVENLLSGSGTGVFASFTISDSDKTSVQNALSNYQSNSTSANLTALQTAVANASLSLKEGSYYFRSEGYQINNSQTETIMSSLANVIGLCAEATNYWSIWDVTIDTSGNYNIVNQGNKYVYTPGQEISASPSADDGYLHYDSSDSEYINVGSVNNGTQNMTITGKYNATYDLVYITISQTVSNTQYDVCWYSKDNLIKFVDSGTTTYGGYTYYHNWEVIPLSAAATTEGIMEGREEKFERVVNELEGYVGGVITLNDVSSMPCLNEIVKLRDNAIEVITKIENGESATLSYTPSDTDYEEIYAEGNHVKVTELYSGITLTNETHPAAMYAAIIKMVGAIKNNTTLSSNYQNLRPSTTDNKYPFFIENVCGNRPAYGARMSQYSDNSTTDSWRAVDVNSSDYDADLATFYAEETGSTTSAGKTIYIMYNVNNFYIGSGNASGGNAARVKRTSNRSEALQFVIDPVIPGIWQMERANGTTGGNNYLTVTEASDLYTIHYYTAVETSSHWKFHTYNHLSPVVLNIDPDATGGNDNENTYYYGTYSTPLNARVPVYNEEETSKLNPVPYYCTSAKIDNTDNGNNSPALLLEFTAATNNGGYYYLKASTGYLFRTSGDKAIETASDGTRTLEDIYSVTGTFISNYDTNNLENNLLVANLTTKKITEDNWNDIFALTYNSADSLIGYFNHDGSQPVYGMGVGFYHIRVGGSLKTHSAYIPRTNLESVEIDDYENWGSDYVANLSTNAAAAKMTFLSADGEVEDVVDAIIDLTDQTVTPIANGAIYDLSGRRVSKPGKGIYIVNGKKVLY